MKIGQVIRALRSERGLTLEAVALEAETDAGNLSRIEQGKRQPSGGLLERIAKALNTSVASIYACTEGGNQPPLPPEELREAGEADYTNEAILLRRYFRTLSPANKRLAVDFVKLLNHTQRGE